MDSATETKAPAVARGRNGEAGGDDNRKPTGTVAPCQDTSPDETGPFDGLPEPMPEAVREIVEAPPPDPCDTEAALVGALLRKPDLFPSVRETLSAEDFYSLRARHVFNALVSLSDSGSPVDLPLVAEEMRRQGTLEKAGGPEALIGFCELAPLPNHAPRYASGIRRGALRRRLKGAVAGLAACPDDAGLLAEVEACGAALHEADVAPGELRGPIAYRDLFIEADALSKMPLTACALPGLSGMIGGGIRAGEVLCIAGYTGEGKSSVTAFEALAHARAGRPVLFLSLELSRAEVVLRLRNALTDGDGEGLPLWVCDDARTLDRVTGTIRKWLDGFGDAVDGPPVVAVDFVQKIRSDTDSREAEVGEAAESLQELARRRGFILLMAAQLNRQSQADGGPQLSHMRDSGRIEQCADVALLLSKDDEDRLTVRVAKSRRGGTGAFETAADWRRLRFGEVPEMERLRPLAEEIRKHLEDAGEAVAVRDICRAVRVPGTRQRPKASDIEKAGRVTGIFRTWEGICTMPSPIRIVDGGA